MPLKGIISPYDDKCYPFEDCLGKLPYSEPFVRAHIDGIYPVIEGEYHVTESLDPPAIIKFKRENDYYVHLWQLTDMVFGTAWHERTEKWIPKSERQSFRYDLGIATLVGTPDLVRDNIITDFKTLKLYSYIKMCESWSNTTYREQLNLYRACGYPDAKELWLEIIIKNPAWDWKADDWKDGIGPIARKQVPLLNPEKVITQAKNNIEASLRINPPDCTDTWNGIRCRRYCVVRTCKNYRGARYELP